MINLVHVISDSNIGGAGKYLINYLENCDKKRFDVKVVLPRKSALISEISRLGFECVEVDGIAEKTLSKDGISNLKMAFKKLSPDIVHSHGCLSARIAAKLCGVKAVFYTRHTDAPVSKKLANPLGRLANRIISNLLSDGIIAVSKAAERNLLDLGVNPKKIKIIYNGVGQAKAFDEAKKREAYHFFGIDFQTPIVAIIARLEPIKGHKYFIDAAKIVGERGYNAKFVIAGTGSCEEELKKYVKDNNVDNVVFLGFVENVSDLNNIMYLQVNASRYEAVGLSVLEGMRLGVPAVVSSFGGNPELTKNNINGFVVNGQDSKEFAERIIQLLEDEALYKKLSLGCIEEFNKNFTASVMSRHMEKFYLSVLEGENE